VRPSIIEKEGLACRESKSNLFFFPPFPPPPPACVVVPSFFVHDQQAWSSRIRLRLVEVSELNLLDSSSFPPPLPFSVRGLKKGVRRRRRRKKGMMRSFFFSSFPFSLPRGRWRGPFANKEVDFSPPPGPLQRSTCMRTRSSSFFFPFPPSAKLRWPACPVCTNRRRTSRRPDSLFSPPWTKDWRDDPRGPGLRARKDLFPFSSPVLLQ